MSALLDVADLLFAYGPRPVLTGVDLALETGQVLALLGPNGSGKSTLIKLLLGHLRGQGNIAWDGRPLHRWRRRELARVVGYLPQSPLWEPQQTVLDVLRVGRFAYWGAFGIESSRDAQVVQQTAISLQLEDLLSRHIDELSGGQRQRVFLGRALVQEPRALLLDEPSTFLDLRHQVELLQLLRKLARERGIAILMASHDLNLAGAYADRMALLHEGKIVAEGRPDQVLDPTRLGEVYGVRMQRINRGEGATPIVVPEWQE